MTGDAERDGRPRLALIAARARNGVIGRDGDLPWRLPEDLAFFKRVTMGKPLLMGRRTWDSLPGRLPGRPHLILTRNAHFHAEGGEVFAQLEAMLDRAAALARASGVDEIMVIGGEALFRDTLDRADRLYLTEVAADVEGDAVFPAFDETAWREVASRAHPADERHAFAFTMRTLERRRPHG